MRTFSLRFRGLLAVLMTLSFAGPLMAASVTASWTHPTSFVDGTTLALSQIASTRVEYGSCSGTAFGTKVGEVTVPAPATSTTITGLVPGTHCFRAYTRTTAAAGGLESGPSGVATKVIAFPAPNPPTIVTIETVARLWLNGKPSLVAGRIALGKECGEFKRGQWAKVDRDDVKLNFIGKLVRGTVVAKCGAA